MDVEALERDHSLDRVERHGRHAAIADAESFASARRPAAGRRARACSDTRGRRAERRRRRCSRRARRRRRLIVDVRPAAEHMHLGRAALERDRRRIERRRARADHADDLAGQRLDGNAAGRVRPHAGRQRAHEIRHVRPTGAGVAVREHELARRLDAPRAVGFQMQAQHVALRLDLDEPRAVAHLRVRWLAETTPSNRPKRDAEFDPKRRTLRGRSKSRTTRGSSARRCRPPGPDPASSACAADACARCSARCRPHPARPGR